MVRLVLTSLGLRKRKGKEKGSATDRAALGEIVDAAGGNEELAEGFESAFAVEAEVEVIVCEDVNDVINNWLVYVDDSLS